MYHGIQNPGDLFFIPGGCPHAVRNLDWITGLSMNYLDTSNWWLHLFTILQQGEFERFEAFTKLGEFAPGLDSEQGHQTFTDFKMNTWHRRTLDLQ